MSEKRRDHRGRILHNGEIQLSDGRYRFKYVDEMGKERCVYSWRLDHNDATPKGKRRTLSLREMEKKIQADHFEQIATNGGNMTVLELVEKYTSTKTSVRPTTVAGYGTVINLLKKDPFGKRRIDTVRISDAKCWLIHLQQVEKKSYSSIHSIRGVLRPAFQLAVDDDLIRKNPWIFPVLASNDEKGNVTGKNCRSFDSRLCGDPAAWRFQCGAGNARIRYHRPAIHRICGNDAADPSGNWAGRRSDYSGCSAVCL